MCKKTILIIFGIVLLFISGFSLFSQTDKVDDWQYAANSVESLLGVVAIFIFVCFTVWLGFSIYMIIIGKSVKKKMNPLRKMGIIMLLAPIFF
ncbi:hypothetical protein ACFLZN_01515, partial [Nanoarchaeota archaeon]